LLPQRLKASRATAEIRKYDFEIVDDISRSIHEFDVFPQNAFLQLPALQVRIRLRSFCETRVCINATKAWQG